MRVIGTFPAGVDELHSAGGAVSAVIDAAFRQADEERAQEELRRKAAIADAERIKLTRAARARQRLARSLRAVPCLR
jgi:hypothetical protein